MLNPDTRSLYTSALTPPPGYTLDQALATTYSLDPQALLTLPTHIALLGRTTSKALDPIWLLESIRRITGRLSVYVDQSSIKVPSQGNVLYGLLESVIVPVQAPRGGVFHPKLWLMRYKQPDTDEAPLLRLIILSRNITFDRSWDVCLQLEGTPGGRYHAANRDLGEFIQNLPALSVKKVPKHMREQAEVLGEEVRKTTWELPEGVEDIDFHTLGKGKPAFKVGRFRRSVIISPFVTQEAIQWFGKSSGKISAVVSRPEELDKLPEETFSMADKWYTLNETAETEDGEEKESHDTYGLHAKVYVMEQGWRTYLIVGSANATGAALVQGKNVEVLTMLSGMTSKVGGIDSLLSEDGLGMVLSEYVRGEITGIDEDEKRAQKALDDAYKTISESGLKILCTPGEYDWDLSLVSSRDVSLESISALRVWPITVSDDRARSIAQPQKGVPSPMGRFGMEALTGLIAFDLTEKIKNKTLRFVLSLPVDGMPEDRDSAIFRRILNNKESFLKYLLLLLGEHDEGLIGQGEPFIRGRENGLSGKFIFDEVPLLEELARAFSRDRSKLENVERVIQRIMSDTEDTSIIPPRFLEIWKVFQSAMAEVKE